MQDRFCKALGVAVIAGFMAFVWLFIGSGCSFNNPSNKLCLIFGIAVAAIAFPFLLRHEREEYEAEQRRREEESRRRNMER